MKAKLIKTNQEMFIHYHLKNENGHTIATTQFPFPSEVEYAADSRGITLQKLSFKNCQEIERGYDLDELAKTIFPDKIFTTNEEYEIPIDGFPYQWGFKVGFQKALELMGGKKFSEEDMIKFMQFIISTEELGNTSSVSASTAKYYIGKFIDKQQQTEWDVEVEMVNTLENGYKNQPVNTIGFIAEYKSVPKLDENGCLILKLKSE